MTLVEQCVQGEGLVQINVEIKVAGNNPSRCYGLLSCVQVEPGGVKKINIVDVLKPAEDPSKIFNTALRKSNFDPLCR